MNAHCPRHSSKYGLWVAYQSTGTSQGLGAIIYVVASALARPARLGSFCLSGRSVEHELSDGLSRHFSFPCWHPVAGPAGAFRIERIAIVPAPGLFEADHGARRRQARLHAVHFHPGRQQARGEGRVGATVLGMTVVKQVAVSIAVAIITVAVAEYVAWVLGQGAP